MARFLVTGGAGFIGSHLVEKLLLSDHEVVVLDNFSSGKMAHLRTVEGHVKVCKGDIRDTIEVRKAMKGCDYVLHHAAVGLVGPTIDNPIEAHDVNAGGTLRILEAARSLDVKRVVLASSAAVYGNAGDAKKRHEDDILRPESPYAATKIAGEYYARVAWELYGLETVSLRYFNVYGPRQESSSAYASALALFVHQLQAGETPEIHGDGEQTRDFVYVDDVASVNLAAVQSDNLALGKAYNVGSGQSISVNDLLSIIQKIMRCVITPRRIEGRVGDVRESSADISLAQQDLGFVPEYDLPKGISSLIKYVIEQRSNIIVR